MAIFDPHEFERQKKLQQASDPVKEKPKKPPRPAQGLVMLKTGDRFAFDCLGGMEDFQSTSDRLWYEDEWIQFYDAKGKPNAVIRRSEILSLYYVPSEEEAKANESK
jgi:hypothetical protein